MHQSAPGTLRAIGLYCQFELVRLFRTRRGIVSLIAFAVIWYLLLRYPIYEATRLMNSGNIQEMLNSFFAAVSIDHLLDWPSLELATYWVLGLLIFPIFAISVSADQIASDRDRGTLRFLCLRSSRDAVLLGRFAGQVLIQAMMILATLAATLVMSLYREPGAVGASALLGLWIGAQLLILILPFIALMALLNCWLGSARLSIFAVIIGFPLFNLAIGLLGNYWPTLTVLEEILPGAQLTALMRGDIGFDLALLAQPILQTLGLLLLARLVFQRSAL